MSAFSEAMKRVADRLRGLQGPQVFDVVTSELTIRTRTWAGGLPGADGGYRDEDLVVPQIYAIHKLSAHEVATSGGRYEDGDVKIGPITPAWSDGSESGGYTSEQLAPAPDCDGCEIIYLLTGNDAGEYRLKTLDDDERFSYYLVISRRKNTP